MNALQNLALEKKPDELQQQTGPDAGTGQKVRDKESPSDNSCSDPNPGATVDHQPEGRVLTLIYSGKTCDSKDLNCNYR